ncbi:MAG: hypothetical protein GY869_13380 [Planctomycetes bacterium]|nr:hypothetical protein [Planctomycetota bacterium]
MDDNTCFAWLNLYLLWNKIVATSGLVILEKERKPASKFGAVILKELGIILDLLALFIPLMAWCIIISLSLTADMAVSMIPHQNMTGKILNLTIFFCMLFGLLSSCAALIFHFIQTQVSLLRCFLGLLVVTANIVNFIGYWCMQMIYIADGAGYLAPN